MEQDQKPQAEVANKKSAKKDILIGVLVIALIIAAIATSMYFKKDTNTDNNQSTIDDTQLVEETDPNEIIASVNGVNLVRKDLDSLIDGQLLPTAPAEERAALQDQALEFMVNQELLYQYASKEVTITDEQIQAEVDSIKGQFADEETFAAKLVEFKTNIEELQNNISHQLTLEQFSTDFNEAHPVSVSDADIQARYDEVASTNEGVPPLEEVKVEVQAQIEQERQQEELFKLIQELRKDANIQLMI